MRILAPLLHVLRNPRFLPVCFIAFVAIRLALILFVPIAEPFSDSGWYLDRAITLLEKGTYSEDGIPTAYWPVGYAGFLAMLFKVTGPSIIVAQFANLLLAAATFWLAYFVALKSFNDETVARCAVLLLTLYPNNAAYVPVLLTETLFTFLLLLGGACLLAKRGWLYIVLGGCALGLATLVKTQTLLLIPLYAFIATWDKWSIRSSGPAVARAAVVTVIAIVVALPWAVRNYNVLGAPVLATNGGLSLLAGNNPFVVGDYGRDTSDKNPLFDKVNRDLKDQIGTDQRARALAYGWIKENPAQFLQLIPKKFFRLWAPDGEAEWFYQDTQFHEQHAMAFKLARYGNQAFYVLAVLLFPFALWGLLSSRAGPAAYLGLATICVFTFISLVFSGQSRYHAPLMPFVLAYAAWVLVRLGAPRPQVRGNA